MFSEDESQVVLLDFQVIALAHPAKDIWYFLSVATGKSYQWRPETWGISTTSFSLLNIFAPFIQLHKQSLCLNSDYVSIVY